jgi:hypothetical protein
VRHALLVEQSHGLLQVLVAGDPEAEMVQAHMVGIATSNPSRLV